MTSITVRAAGPGDGEPLARIHRGMAVYYADLAPDHFRVPMLDGFADELDAEAASADQVTFQLVAEVAGEVVGALVGRLLAPEVGAQRQITPDVGETRPRIDYLAIDESHRRQGVGARLVGVAETWGRTAGATIAETSTYNRSPLSLPFWESGWATRRGR